MALKQDTFLVIISVRTMIRMVNFGCLLYKEPPHIEALERWLIRSGDEATRSVGVGSMERLEQLIPGLGITILTTKILNIQRPHTQTAPSDVGEMCHSLPLQSVEFYIEPRGRELLPLTSARIEDPSGLTCFKIYEGHIVFSVLKRDSDLGPLFKQPYTVIEVGYFD